MSYDIDITFRYSEVEEIDSDDLKKQVREYTEDEKVRTALIMSEVMGDMTVEEFVEADNLDVEFEIVDSENGGDNDEY